MTLTIPILGEICPKLPILPIRRFPCCLRPGKIIALPFHHHVCPCGPAKCPLYCKCRLPNFILGENCPKLPILPIGCFPHCLRPRKILALTFHHHVCPCGPAKCPLCCKCRLPNFILGENCPKLPILPVGCFPRSV